MWDLGCWSGDKTDFNSGLRTREGGMPMVIFKACPRCRGDMHVNRDFYGDYRECLQCGLMEDIVSPERAKLLEEVGVKERAVEAA